MTISCTGEGTEQLELSLIVSGCAKWYSHSRKSVRQFPFFNTLKKI